MNPATELALKVSVYIAMVGPVIAIGLFLAIIVVIDIVDNVKFKKQSKRFGELYQMCIQKHGLAFAQKVYSGCTRPVWIGMDKMISVFEHHCGVKNESCNKL